MSCIFLDYRVSQEELNTLSKHTKSMIIKCPPSKLLYEAVNGHPDMLIHLTCGSTIIVHRDMQKSFIDNLTNLKFNVKLTKSSLNSAYPKDVILNALETDSFFMHKLLSTDEILKSEVKHKKFIDVKQGYTKCSTAVVSENAFMTSDRNIAKALEDMGFDVLLLPPKDIILEGLDYGFIGGTCGLIDKNRLAFFGDLDYYAYGNLVKDFLIKHKVTPIYLRKGKLYDRGSILCSSI